MLSRLPSRVSASALSTAVKASATALLPSVSPATVAAVRTMASHPSTNAPGAPRDKLLFTPGPLLTSYTVKEAMLRDLGSRDTAFVTIIKEIRAGVLKLAGVDPSEFTMIPVQGSGTFGIEGVISTVVPRDRSLLIVANGAYGQRQEKIAKVHGIKYKMLSYADDTPPSEEDIKRALDSMPDCSHVSMVHSETTSGIINDIHSIGKLVKKYGKSFMVDAMSSFGAIPIDFKEAGIDYLITSANKCIQGSPGFAVVVARKAALESSKGNARTLSLDIYEQVKGLDGDGQFRFTPPTHSILAFRQALRELEQEGGVKGREARYELNHKIVDEGLTKLGFKPYLPKHLRGPIISTYKFPNDPNWNFKTFYDELNKLDLVIYPGKVTNADSFRIGHIGHLFPEDSERLVKGIEQVCKKMGVDPRK